MCDNSGYNYQSSSRLAKNRENVKSSINCKIKEIKNHKVEDSEFSRSYSFENHSRNFYKGHKLTGQKESKLLLLAIFPTFRPLH